MSVPVSEMSDQVLALRAYLLALMSIDRKNQGKPPDPWLEEAWAETTPEINRRGRLMKADHE